MATATAKAAFGTLALALAVAVGAWPSPARAAGGWTEQHETGHDIRVKVDDAGAATIEQTVSYRVVAGAMKGFDLPAKDVDPVLEGDVSVTADDGATYAAHLSAREGEPGKLRVDVLDPKGLKRGLYVFKLRYGVDLLKSGAFSRDGTMWRLSWTSPPPPEGVDGERVVFDIPAAPTEPRTDDPGVLVTLRRSAERDELEIVRPHVARGDAPSWVARVDPKAFPRVRSPELRPPPPPPPAPRDERADDLRLAALLAAAAAFGALVRAKSRRVAARCADAGRVARPLVPGPHALRAIGAAAALGGAIAVEASGSPTEGALLVALAMAFAVHRAPSGRARPRGPGSWLMLRPAEVIRAAREANARRSDALDATTPRGKLTALAALVVVAAAAWLAARTGDGELPYLVLLDGVALAPVFVSGTRAQLPPDAAHAPVPFLSRVLVRLSRSKALRATFWARVPSGLRDHDETRLLVVPRAAIPGLVGVEVGVAWAAAAGAWLAVPQVLVRVHEASAASAKMAGVAPFARAIPGRRPEERVLALDPALPTRAATDRLVRRVVSELVDRRVATAEEAAAWSGDDRRTARHDARAPGGGGAASERGLHAAA